MSAALDTNYSSVSSRPIRPLPKRRLRSRLSEDADAALFTAPPTPPAPLFYFPYNKYTGDGSLGGPSSSGGFGSGSGMADGLQDSSDEEDNSSTSVSRGVGNSSTSNFDGAGNGGATDPYEWTENTNNKKNEKYQVIRIRVEVRVLAVWAGAVELHIHLRDSRRHKPPGVGGNRTDPPNAHLSPQPPLVIPRYEELQDVILPPRPVTSTKGKRADSTGGASGLPKQTQFTFVCDSPVSANLAYSSTPATNGSGGDGSPQPRTMNTVGTQTSPGISNSSYQQPSQPAKKKTPRPSRREIYQQQQRRRREEAQSHRNNGEIWICEFCEYESIFGHPPEALMRQYEIKDRKERRRLAEKRRLLEKAKQKGKKNSSKSQKKNSGGNNAAAPPPPPPSATDSQGTQSDNTPVASAAGTPAVKPARQSQQVQTETATESNNHVSNGRGASGPTGGGGKAGVGDSGDPLLPA
ncbi:Similar to hypothetical protein [Tuber melanosporum Mel28]; acc. no. XP_002835335 [Pyronema omphalodes CBS 100304]|uniref:Uncharacterized protein n=1 Tax=Pyronema omphalodes (strain CBS 100304) TaxID=1076935 RepID=U4LVA2_PYROM|nr:Similar to hypothetical protein [Tuber melanosporum Mel28]; acc. no. XP_002835335 [Pyronema omphalodes CBS 100304]